MNPRTALPLVLASIIGLPLSGCGGKTPPSSSPTGSTAKVQLTKNAVVISPSSPIEIIDKTDDSMTLTGPVSLIPGAVILSQKGDGFVCKVKSVQTNGGQTTATIEPASLTDAILSLSGTPEVPLNETTAGPIQSSDSSTTTSWTSWPDAPSKKDVIQIDFGQADRAVSTSADYGIAGSVSFRLHPVFDPVIVPGPNGKGVLKSLDIGVRPEFKGTLSVSQTHQASFSVGPIKYVDRDLAAIPIPNTLLTLKPHLVVQSSGTGNTSFALSAGIKCDATANLIYHWQNGTWTPVTNAHIGISPDVTVAKGKFSYNIKPIEAILTFRVLGIGGPELGAYVGSTGEGVLSADTAGKDTIVVDADAGLYGHVGLKGDQTLVKFLDEIFAALGAGETPTVGKDFTILGTHLHKVFDAPPSDIEVGDDGPLPDDIFEVFVDGVDEGATTKGGTGQFRLNDLTPGSHQLRIVCKDDGANGTDSGTLGISLRNGVTFADGSSNFSTDLDLGKSITLQLIVPPTRSLSSTAKPIVRTTRPRKGH